MWEAVGRGAYKWVLTGTDTLNWLCLSRNVWKCRREYTPRFNQESPSIKARNTDSTALLCDAWQRMRHTIGTIADCVTSRKKTAWKASLAVFFMGVCIRQTRFLAGPREGGGEETGKGIAVTLQFSQQEGCYCDYTLSFLVFFNFLLPG